MTTSTGAIADAQRLVAFMNTRYLPGDDDTLADERAPGWLQEWLEPGLPPKVRHTPQRVPQRMQDLRDLREALRQLAAANNGQEPDYEILGRATSALGSMPLIVELGDHQGRPGLITRGRTTADQAIAAVAWSYLAVRLGEDWRRVKACASSECRWVYLDTSRNRSRRWCEMAHCGNRAKSRAWRQRRSSSVRRG
ncbi:MAG: CGNR zinc finger domain-containing protein [Actinomycetota bacterium]|nr:CGNR zinc finger domain-containing protein [Actinomycetota bacterium]